MRADGREIDAVNVVRFGSRTAIMRGPQPTQSEPGLGHGQPAQREVMDQDRAEYQQHRLAVVATQLE